MPTAILINEDDPLFMWENMMSHRRYFSMMAPLNRFTTLPYLLDPPYDTAAPASAWHLNHQTAHTNFATTLPANYNASTIGLSLRQPLMDSSLADPESLSWWRFAQFREHYLADIATLPLTGGTYPFW